MKQKKKSEWQQHCTPDNCKNWSAVAYYFAKRAFKKLGVTVGIIGRNWGGTSASCWTSREFMEQETPLKPYLDKYDNAVKGQNPEEYIKKQEKNILNIRQSLIRMSVIIMRLPKILHGMRR